MYLKTVFILIMIFESHANFVSNREKTFDNYGPFEFNLSHVESCRGPKSKSLTLFDVTVVNIYPPTVGYNFTFLQPSRLEEIRITIYSVKDKQRSVLWNYRLDKPCQHFIIANTIEEKLNAKNCLVKEGHYYITLNYSDYAKSFFGSSFFYGEYQLKSLVLSSKGNIMCINMSFIIEKQNKLNKL